MWPSWEHDTCGAGKGAEGMVVALYFSVSSGPSAVAFISYSSLGNIINATFFDEINKKDEVYLKSRVVSVAVGPKRSISLSKPVNLSFQHVEVGQICNWSLLGFQGHRWNDLHSLPVSGSGPVLSHMVARSYL